MSLHRFLLLMMIYMDRHNVMTGEWMFTKCWRIFTRPNMICQVLCILLYPKICLMMILSYRYSLIATILESNHVRTLNVVEIFRNTRHSSNLIIPSLRSQLLKLFLMVFFNLRHKRVSETLFSEINTASVTITHWESRAEVRTNKWKPAIAIAFRKLF